MMTNQNQTCRSCGGTSFIEGKQTSYAKIMPMDRALSLGSNLIYTFCANCGEVSSIRVTNPEKFKE